MEEQQAQQQPVAADAGLGGSGSPPQQLLLPQSFVMDPAEFLVGIASQPPSRQGFAQLAGPVAAWFIAASPASEQVANVYLQAAAVQLREPDNTSVAASLGGRVAVGDAEHEEMLRTQQEFEILEVRTLS